MCNFAEVSEDSVDQYLLDIDRCLKKNDCLSFHQILVYKNKKNGGEAHPQNLYEELPKEYYPYYFAQDYGSFDDLQLAEINYLCIK